MMASLFAPLLLAAGTLPVPAPRQAPTAPAPSAEAARSPFGYLTAGALADKCVEQSPFAVSYCYAFLAGVHDTIRAYEVWLGQREFCPPPNVSQKALRDAFVAYTVTNPGHRAGQAASVAVVALKEAYSCSSAKP